MNIETLNIGMKVRHPQYGAGVVKSLTEETAEIVFDDTQRTIAPASSDLQPAEPTATLSELEMPLSILIRDTAHAVVEVLGLEQKDVLVEGLATRWQRGTLVMQPADSSLQPKEIPLETFFHKIVMIDRKSTRLNSSHRCISYAVFCLKKKKNRENETD